jgi:hypothetical protein
MKASVGHLVSRSDCGTVAATRCSLFDHDGAGAVVVAADFNAARAAVGRAEDSAFPKCAACSLGEGWSGALGSGGERWGRPVCRSAVPERCVYAP